MKRFICILILSLFIACDNGLDQLNDWLVGTWNINDKTEYVMFSSDDVFIMNDSIKGSYEISEDGDTEIFYYYISNTGNTEGYGYMSILKREKNSAIVKDFPMHENDTIKLLKK